MRPVSDPIRLEVLKNALEGIADSMVVTVARTARSSNTRLGLDFSTAVLNARGELVGQGMCQPVHLGGMVPALETVLERYRGRIYPGDIFANNDPYEGASHLPDIYLYKPVFVRGVLLGFLCVIEHHSDIGGRVAGGNACDSTEIYQEGLRIPPLKLFQRGEPNETLFRLIEKAVRVPDMVLGDLYGNVAALEYGEREFLKLVDRYGVEDTQQYLEELLDYTERLTRETIRAFPDGQWSFTDYLDDDGISPDLIPIVVTVAKRGDEVHVDFTGTAPQCKGAIQPVFATTKAMAYSVVKCVLGTVRPDIPNTSGYFRPVKVTAPEGTFANPLPPAPVAARALGCFRIAQALLGAFAQMAPDRVYACAGGCEVGIAMSGYDKGRTPWKPWVQLEFHIEQAVGGFAYRDGTDAQCAGLQNMCNVPAEVMETEQPIVVQQYALACDTEGAGKFRGGLGMVREWRYTMNGTQVQMRADRMKRQPYGLHGGHSPEPTRITVNPGGPHERQMPSKFLVEMNRADVLRVTWPGAGGWGDPLERDPQAVLADVVAEKVTPQRARDTYGVVVDVEGRRVDCGATKKLREGLTGRPDEGLLTFLDSDSLK